MEFPPRNLLFSIINTIIEMAFKKYTKKRAVKRVAKKRTLKKKSVVKVVKQVLARNLEKKSVVTTPVVIRSSNPTSDTGTTQLRNYQQDITCNLFKCLYSASTISQGLGQGDRVGNQITCKSNYIKGYMYSIDTSGGVDGNPTMVTMWIGRLKGTVGVPIAVDFTNLLQAGDTAFAPTDDNRTSLRTYNHDYWDIKYRKTFKIGGSRPVLSGYVGNNDFSALRHFSINVAKWHPKNIKYNDTATSLMNAGLYMWFTIANYNDVAMTPSYVPQVQVVMQNDFTFTDA